MLDRIETERFGKITINTDMIFEIEILGFPDCNKYLLIERDDIK